MLRAGEAMPRAFGKYTLLEVCGQGGMGVVYRAHEPAADRIVALKMLKERELASDVDVKRFEDEARRGSSLRHEHIVRVLDVGQHEGCSYFTMDFVDGYTLAERAPELGPRAAATMVKKLAQGVHYAHQRLILHRDLKPANVLLDGDEPRLVDFGIARRLGAPGDTRTSDLVGTLAYMAPEQLDLSMELTSSVDVYGLGAILYELLCGRPPASAATLAERLEAHDPISPRTINKKIDRDLDTVCMRCLAQRPQDRYLSAAGVAADLQRFLDEEPVVARPIGARERAARTLRRHPMTTALAAAALVLLVSVAVVGVSVARAQEAELQKDVVDMNAYAARALAGSVLFELRALADEAQAAVADPGVRAVVASGGRDPSVLDAWRAGARLGSFDSLLILDQDGIWLGRLPQGDHTQHLKWFGWRDYFKGAAQLGRQGKNAVYISRAYTSHSDQTVRFSLVVPIYDGQGTWLGALQAAVTSDDALGDLVLRDPDVKDRTAVLVSRRDRELETSALPDDWFVLLHEGLQDGSSHAMANRGALARLPQRSEGAAYVPQLVTSSVPPLRDDDHLDPIPGFDGTWLAGIAPVGDTPFAVIVQTRSSAALAPNARLGARLLAALGGAVVLAAFASVGLWALDRRRRRA